MVSIATTSTNRLSVLRQRLSVTLRNYTNGFSVVAKVEIEKKSKTDIVFLRKDLTSAYIGILSEVQQAWRCSILP
jgi:hypothetical protein